MDACVFRIVTLCVVPLYQQLVALRPEERSGSPSTGRRSRHDRPSAGSVVADMRSMVAASNRSVAYSTRSPAGRVLARRTEIELRGLARVSLRRVCRHARHVQLPARREFCSANDEPGTADCAKVARRRELLDELLEGQILVRVRGERGRRARANRVRKPARPSCRRAARRCSRRSRSDPTPVPCDCGLRSRRRRRHPAGRSSGRAAPGTRRAAA